MLLRPCFAILVVAAWFTANSQTVWTPRQNPVQSSLNSVVWTGSQLVAVGGASILTSPNGINWSDRSIGSRLDSGEVDDASIDGFFSVAWAGNLLVTVGWGTGYARPVTFGLILTSKDGVSWDRRDNDTSGFLAGITWAGTQVVAVGQGGLVMNSPNGLTWTRRTAGTSSLLRSVAWTGTQLVAVGADGTILTSPNGIDWTQRNSGTPRLLLSVLWARNQLTVVGDSGTLLTSTDGVNWTNRSMRKRGITCVTWSGSRFLAMMAGRDSVLTSADGINWQYQGVIGLRPNFDDVISATWMPSQFVAVGNWIWTSPQNPVRAFPQIQRGELNGVVISSLPNRLSIAFARRTNYQVQILDARGTRKFETRFLGPRIQEIRGLENGVHYVRVISSDSVFIRRVMTITRRER